MNEEVLYTMKFVWRERAANWGRGYMNEREKGQRDSFFPLQDLPTALFHHEFCFPAGKDVSGWSTTICMHYSS